MSEDNTVHDDPGDERAVDIARRVTLVIAAEDVPDINDVNTLASRVLADHISTGNLGPVFAFVNEKFQGEFHAGERMAPVLLRLLARAAEVGRIRAEIAERDRIGEETMRHFMNAPIRSDEEVAHPFVLAEREACAQVADEIARRSGSDAAIGVAYAIRARK